MKNKLQVAIIGASGYTGVELIRILSNHPQVEISALVASANAGQKMENLFGHFSGADLPDLLALEQVDFTKIDAAFCCLPHTTSQEVIKNLFAKYTHLQIFDLSADFRLDSGEAYKNWYGHDHLALNLQPHAVYGLSEFARDKIKKSRLIACPGCYPTSALLPLLPLLQAGLIDAENIIIDSKSAVSGAGRSLKNDNLFCEANEAVKAYGVGTHRHTAEIEQELNKISGTENKISFTPHLIPMSRGIISTIYVTAQKNYQLDDIRNCLSSRYEDEYFVKIVDSYPSTADVATTNFCKIAAFKGRLDRQIILVSVIDNLVKGASGQAVQNMNIRYDFDERAGLNLLPVFPR